MAYLWISIFYYFSENICCDLHRNCLVRRVSTLIRTLWSTRFIISFLLRNLKKGPFKYLCWPFSYGSPSVLECKQTIKTCIKERGKIFRSSLCVKGVELSPIHPTRQFWLKQVCVDVAYCIAVARKWSILNCKFKYMYIAFIDSENMVYIKNEQFGSQHSLMGSTHLA